MDMLKDYHQTGDKEPPNNEMCRKYFLGLDPYQDVYPLRAADVGGQLRAITFVKGPANSTNVDRLIAYKGKYREVLSAVPEQQRVADAFKKMSAKILRAAPKPERFRKLLDDCITNGINPETKELTTKWFGAKNDDKLTMELMQKCAEACLLYTSPSPRD